MPALHRAAAACYAWLQSLSLIEFRERYSTHFSHKPNGHLLPEVAALLSSSAEPPTADRSLCPQLALLVILPLVEKCLYDIHACESARCGLGEPTSQPSMILRDIIASEALHTVLGGPCVRMLRGVFSPQGLNLRNVLWHGFLYAAEVP